MESVPRRNRCHTAWTNESVSIPYVGAYLGPDGTLYVGVLGGIVALRDGEPGR